MNRMCLSALLILLCSGCVQPITEATQQQLDVAMSNQLNDINMVLKSHCDAISELSKTQYIDLDKSISGVKRDLSRLNKNLEKPPIVCADVPQSQLGNKMTIGEVEKVFIKEVGKSLEARVDTGAGYSSLSATNIEIFERNGKEWVRFDVPPINKGDKPITSEARRIRYVSIKAATNSEEEKDRRPVIRAQIRLGNFVTEGEFNLTDRSHLEYPVLLGRRFFKDIAVVDVSHRFIHPLPKTDDTTK